MRARVARPTYILRENEPVPKHITDEELPFHLGELVMCRYGTYPYWPAVIDQTHQEKLKGSFWSFRPSRRGERVLAFWCTFCNEDAGGWVRYDRMVHYHPDILERARLSKQHEFYTDQRDALGVARVLYDKLKDKPPAPGDTVPADYNRPVPISEDDHAPDNLVSDSDEDMDGEDDGMDADEPLPPPPPSQPQPQPQPQPPQPPRMAPVAPLHAADPGNTMLQPITSATAFTASAPVPVSVPVPALAPVPATMTATTTTTATTTATTAQLAAPAIQAAQLAAVQAQAQAPIDAPNNAHAPPKQPAMAGKTQAAATTSSGPKRRQRAKAKPKRPASALQPTSAGKSPVTPATVHAAGALAGVQHAATRVVGTTVGVTSAIAAAAAAAAVNASGSGTGSATTAQARPRKRMKSECAAADEALQLASLRDSLAAAYDAVDALRDSLDGMRRGLDALANGAGSGGADESAAMATAGVPGDTQ